MRREIIALDQNYMPMHEIGYYKALKSVATGRAHILDPKTWARIEFQPDFRLFKQFIVYPNAKAVSDQKLKNRGVRNVLKRDGYECQYDSCKNRATTIDHVLPSSRGGRTSWQNLVACCHACNQKKGSRTPDEAGMKLKHGIRSPRYHLMETFHRIIAEAQAA